MGHGGICRGHQDIRMRMDNNTRLFLRVVNSGLMVRRMIDRRKGIQLGCNMLLTLAYDS
jgi:hypothetical protein